MTPNLGDIALIPVVSMKYPTIGEETGKYRLGVVTKLDEGHVGWVELNGEPHRHFGGDAYIVPSESVNVDELLRAAHQARKNNLWELEERAESLRCVAIKGDAERARNEKREKLMQELEVGMKLESFFHGGQTYTIVKKNRKTVRIQNDENPNRVFSIDPLYLKRWWKNESTD